MREQGVVTRIISGRLVEVAFPRSEACEKCRACHGVGEGMLGVEAVNEVGAKREDVVEVEIPGGEVVRGSIIVFLIPIFMLVIGYLIGSVFMRMIGLQGLVETTGVVLSLVFLALSFMVINWYDKNIQQKEALRARIIKVVTPR
jgi:sigma-E factor negative regulatory protein RseC